jgi:hypothetical protein
LPRARPEPGARPSSTPWGWHRPSRVSSRAGDGPASSGRAPICSGILLSLAEHRPAHLTRVAFPSWVLPRRTGSALRRRRVARRASRLHVSPGGTDFWPGVDALAKDTPDGEPTEVLCHLVDDLVEASVPERWPGGVERARGRLERPRHLLEPAAAEGWPLCRPRRPHGGAGPRALRDSATSCSSATSSAPPWSTKRARPPSPSSPGAFSSPAAMSTRRPPFVAVLARL